MGNASVCAQGMVRCHIPYHACHCHSQVKKGFLLDNARSTQLSAGADDQRNLAT